MTFYSAIVVLDAKRADVCNNNYNNNNNSNNIYYIRIKESSYYVLRLNVILDLKEMKHSLENLQKRDFIQ